MAADSVFILTELDEAINYDLDKLRKLLHRPIIFDGRNCLDIEQIRKYGIEYHSIGRPPVLVWIIKFYFGQGYPSQ